MKIALTIGGSDCSGGAGIQADLKSFFVARVHGASIVTCITAQNTREIKDIYPLPLKEIELQIDAIMEDFDIGATKTGMVYSKEIAKMIAKKMKGFPLVVDPVFLSTTGYSLSSESLIDGLKNYLIPSSFLLTPNKKEAEIICGKKIENARDAKDACIAMHEMGARNVLLKGGHMEGDATDFLFANEKFYSFTLPRIKKEIHGSGCTLSAFITAFLAKGDDIIQAVKKAKGCTWSSIAKSINPGKGVSIIFPTSKHVPIINGEKTKIWFSLQSAIDELISFLPLSYIPEVGINFGYAFPNATERKQICAIEGRIIKAGNKAFQAGECKFGASKHIASIILACMENDKTKRAAMNISYSPKIVEACKQAGLTVGNFSRKDEPPGKSTMEWGTKFVIDSLGYVPDVIWDEGGIGKEAMVRIIGENPRNVIEKLRKICRAEKRVK